MVFVKCQKMMAFLTDTIFFIVMLTEKVYRGWSLWYEENDRIVISRREIVYIIQDDDKLITLGDVLVDKEHNHFIVKSLDLPKNIGEIIIAVTLKGLERQEPCGDELIRNSKIR